MSTNQNQLQYHQHKERPSIHFIALLINEATIKFNQELMHWLYLACDQVFTTKLYVPFFLAVQIFANAAFLLRQHSISSIPICWLLLDALQHLAVCTVQ